MRISHSFTLAILLAAAMPAAAQGPAPRGLTLSDVLSLAQARDPQLAQASAALAADQGAAQAARGAFDTRLTSALARSREESPLAALQRQQFPGVASVLT